jgi:uncharacterized protein
MLRCITFAAALLLLAIPASSAPSFDCSKAKSAAEKTVCEVPDLQWSDRQLARFYKMALKDSGYSRTGVMQSQRVFLARRDACGTDIECLDSAYKAQFNALSNSVKVGVPFGEYEPEGMGGSMWIVRFGYDAAFKILTVGGGGHTCVFETDSAPVGGKGVIRYAEKAPNSCRMTVAPDGDDIMVVQTKNCSDYCGMRAILDGRYKRVQ